MQSPRRPKGWCSRIMGACAPLGLAGVLGAGLNAAAQDPAHDPQPQNGRQPAASLKVTQARVADVVSKFSELTGESVLADAFADEPLVGGIEIGLSDQEFAFRQAVALLQRRSFRIGRVRIARHQRWLAQVRLERLHLPLFPQRYAGSVATRASASRRDALERLPEITLQARERPLGEVLAALERVSGWKVQVAPETRERRITAVFRGITGGEAVAALLEFLNRSGSVSVTVPPGETALEQDWLELQQNGRGTDVAMAMSDALKADVYPLLSDAQRAEILRGGHVSVAVAQLPPRVRAKVRAFAEFRGRQALGLAAAQGLTLRINWTRWAEFRVNVDTDPLLGLDVFLDDGRILGF